MTLEIVKVRDLALQAFQSVSRSRPLSSDLYSSQLLGPCQAGLPLGLFIRHRHHYYHQLGLQPTQADD